MNEIFEKKEEECEKKRTTNQRTISSVAINVFYLGKYFTFICINFFCPAFKSFEQDDYIMD